MIGEYLEIGDKVSIKIEQDNRDWGYNPFPDGTKAEVLGFTEISYGRISNYGQGPGVFENRCWIKLRLEDGRDHTEWTGRLTPVGETVEAYEARVAADPQRLKYKERRKIRDLPETLFWEYDYVQTDRSDYYSKGYVGNINYDWTDAFCYNVSPDKRFGSYMMFKDNQLTLIERGDIWNFYNGKPLKTTDVKELASLFHAMGFTEQVRNHRNNIYRHDSYADLVEDIKAGRGDIIMGSAGLFGSGGSCHLYKFKPVPGYEDIGRRIAALVEDNHARI